MMCQAFLYSDQVLQYEHPNWYSGRVSKYVYTSTQSFTILTSYKQHEENNMVIISLDIHLRISHPVIVRKIVCQLFLFMNDIFKI